MEIGKRLAEKCMWNAADLRKDIRFILEWHQMLRFIVVRQAQLLYLKIEPVGIIIVSSTLVASRGAIGQ